MIAGSATGDWIARYTMRSNLVLLTCFFVLCWSRASLAQSGNGFDLSWSTIDGGGATSSGGTFQIDGTIGQPDASVADALTGGGYTLTGGFWVMAPSCSSYAPADFNRDCVVDNQDFTVFQACSTGPNVPYGPANLPPGCPLLPDRGGRIAADFNRDGSVDQDDFATFQRCWSGTFPADPNCAVN